MPVISFANSKGGSGKSMSAMLLGCELAKHKPTTIIDADPRRPITLWSEMPGVPANLTVVTNESDKTILDDIEAAASKDVFVIIDLEGTASRRMSYAVSQSDLVIIPMKERQQDARAALEVIQEIHRDMKATKRNIPYSILFTQTRAAVKSRMERHINSQFRAHDKVDVFEIEIVERDAFATLDSAGGTLDGLDPNKVNGLEKARQNALGFRDETITKLKALRNKLSERSAA